MRRTWSRTAATTAALVLALGAGGCATADDGGGQAGSPAATATDPEPTPAVTGDATATPSPADTGDASSPTPTDEAGSASGPAFVDPSQVAEAEPGGDRALTVTNIRTAAHDDFDRVVFDLGGKGTPGWRVEYVDQPLDDGSGKPVAVAGSAFLSVRIAGTGMPMDTGVDEYAGGPVSLAGGAVQQVVYRFVFEGYTTAFVGVDQKRPFRVFTLQDPLRLVVDVQH